MQLLASMAITSIANQGANSDHFYKLLSILIAVQVLVYSCSAIPPMHSPLVISRIQNTITNLQ
jgi:hypothetical protein